MNHILQILHAAKRSQRIIWVGLALAVLTACGTVAPEFEETGTDGFDYVTTVRIDSGTTRAEVEAAYGVTAVVFRPEAGFAILGYDRGEGSLSLVNDADSNRGVVASPEATAGGWTAWSGGWTAWSGGWTAWSGGWTAWSGGSEQPSTFGENLPLWEQIGLPTAQQLAPNLGEGVKIAVIDTGVDLSHPAFSGRLAPAAEWFDFVDNDLLPQDEPGGHGYGHGTGVAGVVLQVAPNATILPIRVLDADGSGDLSAVVAGIDHAVAMGADIINLSLGATSDSASLEAIMKYVGEQGVMVVSSTGNTGDGNITYPAYYAENRGALGDTAINVGSVDANDVISEFSTYGRKLEMMAPGERVYTLAPEAGITHWSGTSFAAPMVSGALALAQGQGISQTIATFGHTVRNVSRDIYSVNANNLRGELGTRLDASAIVAATAIPLGISPDYTGGLLPLVPMGALQ